MLEGMALQSWQQRIYELHESYQEISMEHIHKEFNYRIDALSKEALLLTKGFMICTEFQGMESV